MLLGPYASLGVNRKKKKKKMLGDEYLEQNHDQIILPLVLKTYIRHINKTNAHINNLECNQYHFH